MSDSAVKLQKILEYRPELVEKFRSLIESGRYYVSNRAIAQAMMDEGVMEELSSSANRATMGSW